LAIDGAELEGDNTEIKGGYLVSKRSRLRQFCCNHYFSAWKLRLRFSHSLFCCIYILFFF
jgi:hypothetical protein